MGRSPCCDEIGVKKGPWTPEEDKLLIDYIQEHGHGSWRNLPKSAGLNRCGKSCRLRWTNYLRPDIKRGKFTEDEERLIIHLHSVLGNKWSSIATRLEGRTDNEIKNYWNTHLKKKLLLMGIDPVTHRRRTDLDILSNLPSLLAAATNLGNLSISPNTWENLNALRLQADATHLAKVQIMQSMIQLIASSSNPSPTLEAIGLLGSSLSLNNNSGNNSTQFVGDVIQMNRQIEAVLNGSLSLGTQSLDTSLMFSGLQSQENDVNQMMNNNPLYDSVSGENSNVPALVSASPEHVSTCHGMGDNKVVCQNDVSGNSSNSKQFDAWENINTEEDYGWNDIFDQVSFTG